MTPLSTSNSKSIGILVRCILKNPVHMPSGTGGLTMRLVMTMMI